MSNANKAISPEKVYTSRIIKASALLADTKLFLRAWDERQSVSENLSRIRKENIFGKASRSRVEDILTIFHQRYLSSDEVMRSLVVLVRYGFPDEALERIFYFFAT
ncbi:MAG TPA: BrxA family protein, partial [Ktedonobacteraceae bacterium]|nr:BrxA family protein [Ktedonobacteraceae bacterium]